jgi:hypothetical protein
MQRGGSSGGTACPAGSGPALQLHVRHAEWRVCGGPVCTYALSCSVLNVQLRAVSTPPPHTPPANHCRNVQAHSTACNGLPQCTSTQYCLQCTATMYKHTVLPAMYCHNVQAHSTATMDGHKVRSPRCPGHSQHCCGTGCRKMWHLVLESGRLLRWLDSCELLEICDISEQLGEALLRVIRDEEAGPQVAQEFKDTVRVFQALLCCAVLCCAVLCCAVLCYDVLCSGPPHLCSVLGG